MEHNIYYCMLIDDRGYARKLMYLVGKCEGEIWDILEMFRWGKGTWKVVNVNDYLDDVLYF